MMPRRVQFSWGEPSRGHVARAARQSRELLDAGLCGECGHPRHEMLRCAVQVKGMTVRQCFGANPHTRTEYHRCMCLADKSGIYVRPEYDIRPRAPHERGSEG